MLKSIPEISYELDIPYSTIMTGIYDGEIPAIKIGKHWYSTCISVCTMYKKRRKKATTKWVEDTAAYANTCDKHLYFRDGTNDIKSIIFNKNIHYKHERRSCYE